MCTKMYGSVNIYILLYSCNHHLDQDIGHFQHSENSRLLPGNTHCITTTTHAWNNYGSDFYHHRLVLLVLELYIN